MAELRAVHTEAFSHAVRTTPTKHSHAIKTINKKINKRANTINN